MADSGPVIVPLYGVPIRGVIATGDKDLMKAMKKVSNHLLKGAKGDGLDDWRKAHADLEKALG